MYFLIISLRKINIFCIFYQNKSYTPWREGPDDRWIQYKIIIMNVLLHSIIICPLH